QIDLHDPVPGLVGNLIDGLRRIGASVVDEDVDAAEGGQGGLGELFDFAALGHIGDEKRAFAARSSDDFVKGIAQLFFMPTGDDHIGAGFGEATRHREAKALAAAGNQGDFSGKIEDVWYRHDVDPVVRRSVYRNLIVRCRDLECGD